MLAFALVALAVGLQSGKEPSREETRALRELLAPVLFEHDEDARSKAIDAWLERAGTIDPLTVSEIVRQGPLRDATGAAGREGEDLTRIGSTALGYTFESHGLTLRYAVDLPRGKASESPRPLLLDPGHGSAAGDTDAVRAEMMASWRARMQEADLDDWILARTEILEQVGTDGVRGALPEDEVAAIFDDFFRDLAGRFAIDPDRCYVTGLSQTGFWAWYLGAMRADRWAGILPTSAVTWQVDPFLSNLQVLAVCVMHGTADEVCAIAPVRATVERLARLGGPSTYLEIPGGAHLDPFLQSARGLRWMAEHRREAFPRRISKSVATLAQPWCAWLRIEAIETSDRGVARANRAPTAGIDGEIDGQTIRLASEGVERITLALAPELVDLARPLTVVWNGTTVFEGTAKLDPRVLLEIAGSKCDWSAVCPAAITLDRPQR